MKRPKENGANIITKRVMVLQCFPAALTELALKNVFFFFQIFAKIPFSHINTSGLLEDVGK